MPTNAAATGSWTINNLNNARQGRALLQSLMLGANPVSAGDATPMTTPRSGVIVTSDNNASTLFDLRTTVSSGLVLSVKSGAAVINRAGQGPYLGWLLAPVTVTLDPANASNARNDLIVMRVYDGVLGDTVPGTGPCQIEVITGTPSGSPVDPPITGLSGGGVCLVLARSVLAANGTTPTITLLRKSTSLLGGVRVLLEGDLTSDPSFCQGDLRYNPTNKSLEVWTGTAWVDPTANTRAPGHRLVGDVTLTTSTGTFTGSEVLLMSTTFTSAGPSEIYTVEFKGNMVSTTGAPNLVMVLRWRTGNVTLTSADAVVDGAGNQPIAQNATTLFTFRGTLTGVPAGIATVGLTAAATNAVATSLAASATAKRYIRVWDEGF